MAVKYPVRLFKKDGNQQKHKEDNNGENLETPLKNPVAKFQS